MITIRSYTPSDYSALKSLYVEVGWFDPETDKESRINANPDSILLAYEDNELIGSVSLLNTGRHALFFRFITKKNGNGKDIHKVLLEEGEKRFKQMGFAESHILALDDDKEIQQKYEEYGFIKGKKYRWFWKKN